MTPWAGNHRSQGVYEELWQQMEQVGFAKAELDEIERLLALILLIGNIDFTDEAEATLGMHQGCAQPAV